MIMFLVLSLAVLGVVTFVIYLRHKRTVLRHQERMAALEKGLTLPDLEECSSSAPWTPRVYLLHGLLWLFSGVALALMLFFLTITSREAPSMRTRLWNAQELRRGGTTEWMVMDYLNKAAAERQGPPLGLWSIGLVPMGVGMAYLLFYKREHDAGK